ncbi:putative phosphoglycerate dehydrogenase [Aphelenchoides besseyi]|nr:putative phosphoglycerate dehydrogenase [Aphelenchoides besseyi]
MRSLSPDRITTMVQIDSVLIADEIELQCIDVLEAAKIRVVKRAKLSAAELIEELKQHDAVIVRSATKITRAVIEGAAGRLKLIGRAGTGVDNIDVKAATEHGIIVMNTPSGNSRSAAELTSSLILALCRHVPQAAASMKEGRWDRKLFMGSEANGKTLAIIGLGRIGQIVSQHMRAFGMNIVGYDPMVSASVCHLNCNVKKYESAEEFGVRWLPLEEIWPIADFITVHVPLIPQTKNLIGSQTLPLMKRGVRIINVARGGIIDEDALLEALKSGQCAGAAVDVFVEEPPSRRDLVNHPSVIATPHLGASTVEAQERVAVEIAENIVALNRGEGLVGALNAAEVSSVRGKTEATH